MLRRTESPLVLWITALSFRQKGCVMSGAKLIVTGVVLAGVLTMALGLRPKLLAMAGSACPTCQAHDEGGLQRDGTLTGREDVCGTCPSSVASHVQSASPAVEVTSNGQSDSETGQATSGSHAGIMHADDSTFESVFRQTSGTLLVDFHADWCGPCKVQGQILERLSSASQDITIIKVNVDDSPALARQFKISSIPTLLAFRDGALVNTHVGVASEKAITKMFHAQQAIDTPIAGE